MQYFEDTDTLLIALRSNPPVGTQELDENTLIDVDQQGNICSITMEHAGGIISNFPRKIEMSLS